MNILKKLGLIGLFGTIFLCILYFSLIFGISYFFDVDKYKNIAFSSIEKETGFKVTCENISFTKSFKPYVAVHLYHTGIMYPDNTKFIQIKDADLEIRTLPLLFKKFEITNAKLERPIVNITLYKDFSTSIEKFIGNNTFKKNFTLNSIPSLSCKDYKINLHNNVINKIFYLEGKTLEINDLRLNKNIYGNVKIDDFSFNLGNIISSNNSADLIFKGNEAEISSIIHTSPKDSANIKGKFGFGRKRAVNLNAKAKNINLENLFKIANTTTRIFNIKNPFNDISAKGLINADFNIKSDFKKLYSEGNAQIINASLTRKSLKYPVSNINAEINFNNNQIKIEKALAVINRTPIRMEGTVSSNLNADLKAYANNLDLNYILSAFLASQNLPVDVKNGSLNFEAFIKGNLGKDFTTKANISINNFVFTEEFSKTSFKIPEFKFSIDDKTVDIPENKIIFINSPLFINGKIENYIKNPIGKINFEGNIFSKDIGLILSNYIKHPYKSVGELNTKGIATLKDNKLHFQTQISADKDNYVSYLVIKELLNKPSFMNISIETDKEDITIKDISLSDEKEPKIKVSGLIKNIKEPVLKNLSFVIPNTLSAAANFFGGEEISLKTDLLLNGNPNNPDITGNVSIQRYNLKKYLTSIKNADISFLPKIIRVSAPDTAVNDSSFNVTADVIPDLKNITVKNLRVSSVNLDVNSLYDIIHNLKDVTSQITVQSGSATINRFKLSDIKANDISSDFKLEKNILKISNINASAYAGFVTGNADYEINTGILDLNMTGRNLDIKNSLYDLCKYDDNISGQADVKAKLSMLTGTRNTASKTLSGTFEFNAKNGSMGTLGKFEYYLYAKNLLYHGLLNTTLNRIIQTISHTDTAHFRLANGRISFQNGYLITDNLHTQGENMSLYIKGRHNILTNQSSLDIYGRISDEISKKMGSFADVSISDIINGQPNEINNIITKVPNNITGEILPLYNGDNFKSNMFKVSVTGNIKALNAINSFTWIVPNGTEPIKPKEFEETNSLPDFSDL